MHFAKAIFIPDDQPTDHRLLGKVAIANKL